MKLWEGPRGLEEYARGIFPLEEEANGMTWVREGEGRGEEGEELPDNGEDNEADDDGDDESVDEGLIMVSNFSLSNTLVCDRSRSELRI